MTQIPVRSRMMQAIAGMSKDMRTPMSAILCMLDLLQDAELTTEQRDQVSMASKSARMLQNTLSDIVDASWIEAGLLALDQKPFNLKETLEDTAQLMAAQMLGPELDFVVEYPFNAPIWLIGDATRMRQIMMNLLRNIADSAQSDHVLVKIELKEKQEDSASFCVHITDSDTGMMLLSTPQSTGGKGSTHIVNQEDLHLAISRELVTMMGGQIQVDRDHGTDRAYAFTFTLPLADMPEEQHPEIDANKPVQVFLIDNCLTSRRVLASRLRHWGGKGEAFSELAPALDSLKSGAQQFDVLLLSYPMPGLDARAAKELLSKFNPRPRILLMSRLQPTEENPETILQLDDAVSVVKPVRESQLLDIMYPARRQQQEPITATPPTDVTGHANGENSISSTKRVLLVEDSPIIRKVAIAILEKLGCHVDVGVNGQEGLGKALATPYDVIFMDCEMPIMDGLTATREIRTNEKGRHTPILAMTSFNSQKDKEMCLTCGMDEIVPKPIDKDALIDALNRFCPADASSPAVAPTEPLRILIVEDDRSLRTLIHINIRKLFPKAEIRVANNGMEACALVGSFQPKMIVTDVMMPEMDAVAMIRFLKSKKRYSASKILVVTALGSSDSRIQEIRRLGVEGILHKPFRMPDLLQAACDTIGVPFDPELVTGQDGKKLVIWNRARAMRTLDNDAELLKEVVAAYLEDGREDIRAFEMAAQRRDGPMLGKVAHKIKGTAVGLGAELLFQVAADVEDAVREDNVVDFDKAVQTVSHEFERLCETLEQDVMASS